MLSCPVFYDDMPNSVTNATSNREERRISQIQGLPPDDVKKATDQWSDEGRPHKACPSLTKREGLSTPRRVSFRASPRHCLSRRHSRPLILLLHSFILPACPLGSILSSSLSLFLFFPSSSILQCYRSIYASSRLRRRDGHTQLFEMAPATNWSPLPVLPRGIYELRLYCRYLVWRQFRPRLYSSAFDPTHPRRTLCVPNFDHLPVLHLPVMLRT